MARSHYLSILIYRLRRGGRTSAVLADIDQFAWQWFHDLWEEPPKHPVWAVMADHPEWSLEDGMDECRRRNLMTEERLENKR